MKKYLSGAAWILILLLASLAYINASDWSNPRPWNGSDYAGQLLLDHETTIGELFTANTGYLNLLKDNFAGSTAPTSPSAGQIWYDSDVGIAYLYNGTSWPEGKIYNAVNADTAKALSTSTANLNTINEATPGSGVTVDGCLIKDGEATVADTIDDQGGGNNLKVKVLNIGDWDMDSFAQNIVVHGLTKSNIRSVTALIRDDNNSFYYNLNYDDNTGTAHEQGISLSSSSLYLNRIEGGFFDGTNFDSSSYNRGWITVWYTE